MVMPIVIVTIVIGALVMIPMGIITVVLLRGHGAMLIAGYNTASQAERDKYDEKKLCRSIGVCMLASDILLAALLTLIVLAELSILPAAVMNVFIWVFIGVLIVMIAVTLWYANVKCKK